MSALRERDDGRGRSVLHDLGESDEGHDSLLEVGHLEGLEVEAGGPDGFWGRGGDFICHEVDRGGGDMGVSEVGKVGTCTRRYWLLKYRLGVFIARVSRDATLASTRHLRYIDDPHSCLHCSTVP